MKPAFVRLLKLNLRDRGLNASSLTLRVERGVHTTIHQQFLMPFANERDLTRYGEFI